MKSLSIQVVRCVIAIAAIVFVWTVVHALWYAPDSELSVPSNLSSTLATSSPPVRLRIPSLDIDTTVQQVGISKRGAMAVPNNYTDVGWYRYGTVPGMLGSAVIDGHVDNGFALPGVFKNLSNIQKGADVYIMTKGGSNIHFVVTGMQIYPYDNAPANLIFNRGDTARLNLITCHGSWVAADKTYGERLVVFTELQVP